MASTSCCWRSVWRTLVVGALLACFGVERAGGSGAPQDAAATDDAAATARYCLNGFQAGREQVRSGRVQLVTQRESAAGPLVRHTYDVVFDRLADCLRIEHQYGGRQVRTIRRADQEMLYITPPGTMADVFHPGATPDVDGSAAIDIDSLGIATLAEFELGHSWEKLRALLAASRVESAEDVDGRCRVTWEYAIKQGGSARRTVWFDQRQGFVPTRMELVVQPPKAAERVQEPLEWVTTTWKQIDAAWVPIRSEMHRRQPQAKMVVELTWSEVNQDIPPADFELDAIAPAECFVADHRLGDGSATPLPRFMELDTPPKLAPWRFGLIAVNAAIVLLLVAYWGYRRRWPAKPGPPA